MPYIKSVNRPKFKDVIQQALIVLNNADDNLYVRGEYFAYLANRVFLKFLNCPNYMGIYFNSNHFNVAKKDALASAADGIISKLDLSDAISSAGELNYALSAVFRGLLGEGGPQFLGYGIRAFLDGNLAKIEDNVRAAASPTFSSTKDAIIHSRREGVVRGVLKHLYTETYRVSTAVYEDTKKTENGDVWSEGRLI
jgi:hypothetical protein